MVSRSRKKNKWSIWDRERVVLQLRGYGGGGLKIGFGEMMHERMNVFERLGYETRI